MAETNNSVPLITFIPLVICCIAIALLLQHRSSQQRDRVSEGRVSSKVNCCETCVIHFYFYPTADAAAIAQLYQDAEMDELEEDGEIGESVIGDEDQDNDPQEGTSTAVRVKKVGKKRAEKLKRKEHMRQYREVSSL